jgi:glycosyltransferase involved in cell wall biosynthesis
MPHESPKVAVLVPCYNEAPTVQKVVRDFRQALPDAKIYVFDNNSSDGTAELATEAGAIVVHSPRQGKGNVVRHMFDVVDADLYIMVDGDDTYPASAAPELIEAAVSSHADMLVGTRLGRHDDESFRPFHVLGNKLVAFLISLIFRLQLTDVLSGYRVFSRRFVRIIPLSSQGFEIETELTLKAAARNFLVVEHPISYGARPEGSYSKLSTFGDGALILSFILALFKDYKPLTFFSLVGIALLLIALAVGVPALATASLTGPVTVSMLVAATLTLISAGSVGIGLLLHSIRTYVNENFELLRKIEHRPTS